jgi:hypothetical protein
MSQTLGGQGGVAVQADYVPAPQPPGLADPTTPSLADYVIFLRQYVGIPSAYLPDNSPWITTSYNIAIDKVNNAFAAVSSDIYTLMVYNYATDRLINFAPDQPGQCYFADLRKTLGINNMQMGIIQSSSDQGTSQSWMLPDWIKSLTLSNMQMMNTPYGRAYLGFAQEYGTTLWGLTR